MVSSLCCRRVDPSGSSAALVAAWLLDAMAGIDGVRLRSTDLDTVVLDVTTAHATRARAALDRALAEPRFAGWQPLR